MMITNTASCTPNEALRFLQDNLLVNSQIVIMSHYGPYQQNRLANDELWNLCQVLKNRKARVIAWLAGHTHKSDYYEWTCGNYIVPVFHVGSAFYGSGELANAGKIHFSYFRIDDGSLEALDVGVSPSDGTFSFGSANEKPNELECNESTPTGRSGLDDHDYPFGGGRRYANFDSKQNISGGKYCNPDLYWGGWQVRVPICAKGVLPYPTTANDLTPQCAGAS